MNSVAIVTVPLPRIISTATTRLVDAVRHDFQTADVSPKLRALLAIAAKVQQGGKHVTASDIEHARATGATDQERSTTLS